MARVSEREGSERRGGATGRGAREERGRKVDREGG